MKKPTSTVCPALAGSSKNIGQYDSCETLTTGIREFLDCTTAMIQHRSPVPRLRVCGSALDWRAAARRPGRGPCRRCVKSLRWITNGQSTRARHRRATSGGNRGSSSVTTQNRPICRRVRRCTKGNIFSNFDRSKWSHCRRWVDRDS